MNANPRQLSLLEEVRKKEALSVEALAEHLGVTLQTVRRDIARLSESGLLTRFHGGVRVPSSTIQNIAHQQRTDLNADKKQQIAVAVSKAVPDNCSLILNLGTTTEAIAQALKHHSGLRVITNNLRVASLMSLNTACEVIIAGGRVRASDQGIIGEDTVEFMAQFKVDIALIGISGIEDDGSLRDYDYREVKVTQTIMKQARQVWLATDVSKFNRPAMVEVGRLSDIDRLFTDSEPPQPFPQLLKDSGVRCMVASTQQADEECSKE